VTAALTVGCGADPVRVEAPTPDQATADVCNRLEAALPDHLDGADRRPTEPESPLTAAWGDPALDLRCGVPRPAGLGPTSEVIEVEGVEWFLVESAAGYAFTTVGRVANVELTVPAEVDRSEATAPLVDLASAIRRVVSDVTR
jgi:hypothetical protein